MVMNKTAMALLMAWLGLLDNMLSYCAVMVNPRVRELNPIVGFFMQNPTSFALFTVFKCSIMFFLAYQLDYKRKTDLIMYIGIAVIFSQAIVTALANILAR